MADSPPRPLCDYCDSAPALLYCRADSAKLCFACDREVHATNPLFAKHARARLCDACAHAPAAIFCSAETSVLCHDCDWESHGRGLGQSHDRRPLEGFNGCPSVSELLAILGFEGFDKKALLFGDSESGGFCGSEIDDFLVWDVPCSVGLDDLIFSDSSRSFQAMGVPPLPKNRNAVCGQRKDDVLGQLRELAKTEHESNYENAFVDSVISFEAIVPEQNVQPGRICIDSRHEAKEEANTLPPSDSEARLHQWFVDGGDSAHQDLLPEKSMRSHLQESYRDSEKHADVGDSLSHANNDNNEQPQHQIDSKAESDLHRVAPYELTSQERETAISRYKEKKKTRRFEKRIRYESRKVRAESRTRVKGRFAKIEH